MLDSGGHDTVRQPGQDTEGEHGGHRDDDFPGKMHPYIFTGSTAGDGRRARLATLGDMIIEERTLTEDADLAQKALALARAAEQADGVAPLSEQFVLGITDARLAHRHLVALDGGRLIAVAALEGEIAELVVDPGHRRAGIGTQLYRRVREVVPGLQTWAHGDLPGARALAGRQGLKVTRELLVLEITGRALDDASRFTAPADFAAVDLHRSREKFGAAKVDQAWLDANNDAFSWHPEQGGWDLERLERAQEVDWFSDRDVLFLWDEQSGPPRLAGFHWTKWHDEETPGFGEVYVVGLAADYRGRGLGTPILLLGLDHLRAKGAERIILYVEADNAAAVKVYQNSGFAVAERHTVYA